MKKKRCMFSRRSQHAVMIEDHNEEARKEWEGKEGGDSRKEKGKNVGD